VSTAYTNADNIRAAVEVRSSRWQVLRSRACLVVLAAQAASLPGDFFNYVAVAWLVLELTGSNLAVGGVLVAAVGAGAALAADAAGYGLAGLLVIALPSGSAASNGSANNALQDIWDGILAVSNDVPLRTVVAVIAVVNFLGLPGVQVGLPALAYARFGLGVVALGGGFAAFGLGAVAGALGASAVPAPRLTWLIVGTAVVFGASLAVVGVAPTLPLLLVGMGVMGVVAGASNPYLVSWLQRRTDTSMQGRMLSLVMLASVGLEPLGLALGGVVAERNLELLFWGAGGLIVVIGIASSLSRSVRAA
jgi:MFS transporter, ENTS family, enterobactin (siderophore) exporter